MVHVKKCPLGRDKRRPSTEFYINGKPQIYCYGWIDLRYDELFPECKECADQVDKAQADLEKHLAEQTERSE